jgi:hypothetical protein
MMKAVMLGYWVVLVGIVVDVVGTVWDAIDALTGEEALGGAPHSRKAQIPRNNHSNPGPRLRVTDGVETPNLRAWLAPY